MPRLKRTRSFVILTTLFPIVIQPAQAFDKSGAQLLSRALYFADLYNWHAAAPLFKQAEPLLREAGDTRNAMFAHVGTLRVPQGTSIAARSQQLCQIHFYLQLYIAICD